MMRAYLVGTQQVMERFEKISPEARNRLRVAVRKMAIKLNAYVKSSKLSGQVLNVVTGTLRRGINYRTNETLTGAGAVVGTNVSYAHVHEYGFKGTVNVRAHLRQVKQVFGRKLKEPINVVVPAHTMKMNIKERSFLRSALLDMEPEIRTEMTQAVTSAAREAK